MTLGVVFLPAPATVDTVVTITSNNPSVTQVTSSPIVIPAGSRIAAIGIVTGTAGTATLTLETADGLQREFAVQVDTAPVPSRTPVAAAVPVGVSVVPSSGGARLIAAAGAPVSATVGVQLLTSPRPGPLSVTVTTSNPSIVSFGASTTVTASLDAGSLVVPVGVTTTGTEGAAILAFEFEGVRREVLFIVGSPPASQLPAVVAPVVGVRVP